MELNINEVKVYSDAQNELLKVYLLGLINTLDQRFDNIPDSFLVFNPTNGMQNDINKTLNDIYSQTRTGALTASEYDNLQLTANGYDSKQLTATITDLKERFSEAINEQKSDMVSAINNNTLVIQKLIDKLEDK